MSKTTTPKRIKAKTGFHHLTAANVLSTALNIFTNFFASTAFTTAAGAPPPPVDQVTLKSLLDTLQTAIAAAATGAKAAITAMNHAKEAVATALDQLATYVSANCKGDMNVFMTSGFTPVSSTKAATPPVSERIKKLGPTGNAGEMAIMLMKFPGAASYQVQWGVPGPGGSLPTAWSSVPVTIIKTPTVITGLTPGMTYVFQARAVVQGKYTDWGDPIARIAV